MFTEGRRMRRTEPSREAGFTIIEIIVVMILIGVLAALAIPRFPEFPRAGVAARRLLSDIRYAKELSTRLQTMSGIYFINNTQYRVFINNDTNSAAKDPQTGTNYEVTMSGEFAGVTLSQTFTNSILKFNSLGTPLEGSGAGSALAAAKSVTVSGAGGPRTVTIEPNTGKVTGS
jgi:prepilin-type N-terminal cleavage/methylation domain-containing protein